MSAQQSDIDALLQERMKLDERIVELRREIPPEPVAEYTFQLTGGRTARLAELFGDKEDLLLIHNMGASCSYCTLWADGFNGVAQHLADRAAFVVVSPDDPESQEKFAASRGWKFAMASAKGTDFPKAMGFEPNPGEYWPGVSAFHRDADGTVTRVARDFLGPGDNYCSVWHLFGLLDKGVNNWEPQYRY